LLRGGGVRKNILQHARRRVWFSDGGRESGKLPADSEGAGAFDEGAVIASLVMTAAVSGICLTGDADDGAAAA
jgi:hypothetical protein